MPARALATTPVGRASVGLIGFARRVTVFSTLGSFRRSRFEPHGRGTVMRTQGPASAKHGLPDGPISTGLVGLGLPSPCVLGLFKRVGTQSRGIGARPAVFRTGEGGVSRHPKGALALIGALRPTRFDSSLEI